MAIVLDGNLGITTPAETVQGALTTTGNTILGDATTDTLTVGVTGIVKDASGNVGIGTASPTGILHTVATNGVNILESSGVSSVGLRLRTNSVDRWQIQVPSGSSDLAIYTGAAATQQVGITSAGLLQFNSGYGSAATAYGCRAWVNFNGTGTVAIRGSGNVSSITDNATGLYTVNFTTAIVDANYSINITSSSDSASVQATGINGSAPVMTTTACPINIWNPNPPTNVDRTAILVSVFR